MSTTYFETDTNSDLNVNTANAPTNSKKLLTVAPGSATSQTITLASSAINPVVAFITEPGEPGATGGTGSQAYTVTINVTTANANLTGSSSAIQLRRYNSAGTLQTFANLTTGPAATWPQSTGVKTWSGSVDLSTFVAGDRLALNIQLTNGAMSVQSLMIEVGLASGNEQITAPWGAAAAASMPWQPAPSSIYLR